MKRFVALICIAALFCALYAGGFLLYLRQKEGYTPLPDGQSWELNGLFTGEHSRPDPMDNWPVLKDWPALVLDYGDRILIWMPKFTGGGGSFWNFYPENVGEFVGGSVRDLKPGRWCRLEFELSENGIRWDSYMMGYDFPRTLEGWGTVKRVEVLDKAPKNLTEKAVAIYHQAYPWYRNTSRWTWLRRYSLVAVPLLAAVYAGIAVVLLKRWKKEKQNEQERDLGHGAASAGPGL